MKKYFAIVAMVAACTFGMTPSVMAQEEVADEAASDYYDNILTKQESSLKVMQAS